MAESTAVVPPIEPMLAKLVDSLPEGAGFLYEPKWDGFRAIVFRGDDDVYIQSRDLRPLDRYFPELHDLLVARLPRGSVVDGEIVITTPHGLDFDALQLRLHPAASRVAKLAKESPASFVAFDLLAMKGKSLMSAPQHQRRAKLGHARARSARLRVGRPRLRQRPGDDLLACIPRRYDARVRRRPGHLHPSGLDAPLLIPRARPQRGRTPPL